MIAYIITIQKQPDSLIPENSFGIFNKLGNDYKNTINKSYMVMRLWRFNLPEEDKGNLDKMINQQLFIQQQLKNSRKYLEAALKLGNKFFDINMQIDGNISNRSKVVRLVSTSLLDEGFIVDAGKIFSVDVNKAEVIYYSHYAEHAAGIVAEDITKILTNEKMNTRLVKSSDRNRYKILIKIANP